MPDNPSGGKLKSSITTIIAGVGSSVIVGGGIAAGSTTLLGPTMAPIGQLTGLVILGLGSLYSFVAAIAQLGD